MTSWEFFTAGVWVEFVLNLIVFLCIGIINTVSKYFTVGDVICFLLLQWVELWDNVLKDSPGEFCDVEQKRLICYLGVWDRLKYRALSDYPILMIIPDFSTGFFLPSQWGREGNDDIVS